MSLNKRQWVCYVRMCAACGSLWCLHALISPYKTQGVCSKWHAVCNPRSHTHTHTKRHQRITCCWKPLKLPTDSSLSLSALLLGCDSKHLQTGHVPSILYVCVCLGLMRWSGHRSQSLIMQHIKLTINSQELNSAVKHCWKQEACLQTTSSNFNISRF